MKSMRAIKTIIILAIIAFYMSACKKQKLAPQSQNQNNTGINTGNTRINFDSTELDEEGQSSREPVIIIGSGDGDRDGGVIKQKKVNDKKVVK
jgi:hypothetical protein